MQSSKYEIRTVTRNGVTAHVVHDFVQDTVVTNGQVAWKLVEEAVLWFDGADGKPVYSVDDPTTFSNLRRQFGLHPDLVAQDSLGRPRICPGVAAESGGPWLC